jgi:hypothetical protein
MSFAGTIRLARGRTPLPIQRIAFSNPKSLRTATPWSHATPTLRGIRKQGWSNTPSLSQRDCFLQPKVAQNQPPRVSRNTNAPRHKEGRVGRTPLPYPNGIASSSPGSLGTSYPGSRGTLTPTTPNGVASIPTYIVRQMASRIVSAATATRPEMTTSDDVQACP